MLLSSVQGTGAKLTNKKCTVIIGEEKPTDDTGTDVHSQLVKSHHVSGIIVLIIRRTDCIKPR